MRKRFLKIFTSQNGIILTKEALACLESNIKSEGAALALLQRFKSKFNTSSITPENIQELLIDSPDELAFFKIEKTKYNRIPLSRRYEEIKKRFSLEITSISMLSPDEPSVIFGLFYFGLKNEPILEDDHGVVRIRLNDSISDAFLYENIFVGLEGYLVPTDQELRNDESDDQNTKKLKYNKDTNYTSEIKEREFNVKRVIYPTLPINKATNSLLVNKSIKLCAFSCLTSNIKLVEDAIKRFNPEMIIYSACIKKIPAINFTGTQIVFPCRCNESYIPERPTFEFRETDRLIQASNPFSIEFYNLRISFIDANIFKHKENGIFCGANPLDSFISAVTSQHIYNLVGGCDTTNTISNDIIVLFQDFYPLIKNINGIRIVSLPKLNECAYMYLDTANATLEIINKDTNN